MSGCGLMVITTPSSSQVLLVGLDMLVAGNVEIMKRELKVPVLNTPCHH